METIKDIRARSDARFYREQFQLSKEYEDRWLTLSYIVDGDYKILHLITDTPETLREFETILRQLHSVRHSLMSGLGDPVLRQALWERQYWTSSDQEKDEKLVFEEVAGLCKRLNIASSSEDILRIFKVRHYTFHHSLPIHPWDSKRTEPAVTTWISMISASSSSCSKRARRSIVSTSRHDLFLAFLIWTPSSPSCARVRGSVLSLYPRYQA